MDRRWLTATSLLTGCHLVFGVNEVSPEPDASSADGPDVPACVEPLVVDRFDAEPPCAAWGFTDEFPPGTTTVTVTSGQLVLSLAPDTVETRAGCLANGASTFGPSGVFVETDSTIGGGQYKFVAAESAGNSLVLSWSIGAIKFGRGPDASRTITLGTIAFDPVATRWARMRPLADKSATVAEVGPDGLHWTQFGIDPITPPETVRISMLGGSFAAAPAPPPIRFDSLNACPK